MSKEKDREGRAKRFRNKAEECRTAAESMKDSDSRARLLRLAETYEHLAEMFETVQLPCKVKGRDQTGKELEILCITKRQAEEVHADLCRRGYIEVEIQSIGVSGTKLS